MLQSTCLKTLRLGIIIGASFITHLSVLPMIWHIWWLAIVFGLVGSIVTFIARAYTTDVDYYVQPDEIARSKMEHLA